MTSLSFARGFAVALSCAAVLAGPPVHGQAERPTRPLHPGPVGLRPIISAARAIVMGTVTGVEPLHASADPDSVTFDLKRITLVVSDVFRGTVSRNKPLELRQIVPAAAGMAVGDRYLWFVAADDVTPMVPLIGMYAGSFRVADDPRSGLVGSTIFDNRGLWGDTQSLWDLYPREETETALRRIQSPPLSEERIQHLMEWGEIAGSQRPMPVDLLRVLSGVGPITHRRLAAR
jgi:hypothetical protein